MSLDHQLSSDLMPIFFKCGGTLWTMWLVCSKLELTLCASLRPSVFKISPAPSGLPWHFMSQSAQGPELLPKLSTRWWPCQILPWHLLAQVPGHSVYPSRSCWKGRIHLLYYPFPHPALTQESRHPFYMSLHTVLPLQGSHGGIIPSVAFSPTRPWPLQRWELLTYASCYPQLPSQRLISLLLSLIMYVIQGNKFR